MTPATDGTIVISAGESSGDLHGGNLVLELKRLMPKCSLVGLGGAAMAEAGVSLLHHADQLGVTGLVEVVGRLSLIRKALRDLKALIREQPRAVILIDYPDFNFRLARFAHRLGVPVIYYISPQIWAWRQKRVFKIQRWVTRMLVIIPFEEEFYRRFGVPVTYVGYPLLDQWDAEGIAPVGENEREDTVCLLPGSRSNEIRRLLPVMVRVVETLHAKHPRLRFVLLQADTITAAELAPLLTPAGDLISIVTEHKREQLARARLVITASGTATMECALAATPMLVLYRMSRLTFSLVKRLVRVPAIGMVNLLAKKHIVPEFVQNEVRVETIVAAAERFLSEPDYWRETHRNLLAIRALLGEPGASARAAQCVAQVIAESASEESVR